MLDITPLKLVKQNEKGNKFFTEQFTLFTRVAGSISGPNKVDYEKVEYLLSGKALINIPGAVQEVVSPCKILTAPGVKHSITAKTDCIFLKMN